MRPRILIIDSDDAARRELASCLPDGSDVLATPSLADGMLVVGRLQPHLVAFDPGAADGSGDGADRLLIIEKLRQLCPSLKIIVVAAGERRDEAATALSLGAFDYCVKPVDPGEFLFLVRRALRIQALEEEALSLPDVAPRCEDLDGVIGSCEAMREVVSLARRTAVTEAPVLLVGEPGTGKELIARAIHRESRRCDGPFVAWDAGAVPEERVEAELFGDGRATDLEQDGPGGLGCTLADGGPPRGDSRPCAGRGALGCAHRGTLYAKDVCRLSLPVQARLCAFLENRATRDPDVRVIASSDHSLHTEARSGAFRDDLLYRLGVVTITVPPLRERGEDVPLLAAAALARCVASERRKAARFARSALRAMTAHSWPGNIPEMESRVTRAVVLARGERITARDLGLDDVAASPGRTLKEARDELERAMSAAALRLAAGNVSRAARAIGVARPTMYDLIRKHGLVLSSFKASPGTRGDAEGEGAPRPPAPSTARARAARTRGSRARAPRTRPGELDSVRGEP